MSFTVRDDVPLGILPSKLQDPNGTKFVEVEAFRKIQNLTTLLDEEKKKSYILHTPVGGVSYSVWNKIMLCSVGCSICILVWFWRHNHQTISRNHDRIVKTIAASLETRAYSQFPPPGTELEAKQKNIMSVIKSINAHSGASMEETNGPPTADLKV